MPSVFQRRADGAADVAGTAGDEDLWWGSCCGLAWSIVCMYGCVRHPMRAGLPVFNARDCQFLYRLNRRSRYEEPALCHPPNSRGRTSPRTPSGTYEDFAKALQLLDWRLSSPALEESGFGRSAEPCQVGGELGGVVNYMPCLHACTIRWRPRR